MALTIYLGGRLVDEADAKISVFDHGLLYGDGVFEGIRVYGGKVFLHRQHIERLFESAKAIRLTIPLTPDEVMAAVELTVKANTIHDGYVRLVVTRGAGSLGLDIRKTSNPQVIVIADTITERLRSVRVTTFSSSRTELCGRRPPTPGFSKGSRGIPSWNSPDRVAAAFKSVR